MSERIDWQQAVSAAEREAMANPPRWREFLVALRSTEVFTALRTQARSDVATNALATELRTLLGEAALGLAEPAAVQELMGELLPALTPGQVAEIDAAIAATNVPLTTG